MKVTLGSKMFQGSKNSYNRLLSKAIVYHSKLYTFTIATHFTTSSEDYETIDTVAKRQMATRSCLQASIVSHNHILPNFLL